MSEANIKPSCRTFTVRLSILSMLIAVTNIKRRTTRVGKITQIFYRLKIHKSKRKTTFII